MRYIISAFALIFMLVSCSNNTSVLEYEIEVNKVFDDWSSTDPGASIAIIRNGQVEYAKGYGMANMEYKIPNVSNSVFRIASTSKQFTAACIVLLEEQGKLSLEDSLSKFFPKFPDYANKITVRQLLNHTSGIRDYLQLTYLAGFNEDDFYTDKDVMNFLVNQKELNFLPGEEFLYSNSGYWLLSQIVLKVTGNSMAKFALENIFEPLKMNNTHFHDNNAQVVLNRATGYTPVDNHFEISMTQLEMIGDGGIFTTVEDMAKWIDNFSSHKVGSSKFTNTMQTRAILNNGDTLKYALGLNITKYKDKLAIRHGGAFVGFRAEMIRFPTDDLAIIVLANRSDAQPSQQANKIADILFNNVNQTNKEIKIKNKNTPLTLSTKELSSYVGTYWNDKRLESKSITLKKDTLYISNYALLPTGLRKFNLVVSPTTEVSFTDKKISIKSSDRKPREYTFYKPVVYEKSELKEFIGNYYNKELQVYYHLQIKDEELMLKIGDKEILSLSPTVQNIFLNNRIGVFEFVKTNNKISGFILTSGRVKNLRFDKKSKEF